MYKDDKRLLSTYIRFSFKNIHIHMTQIRSVENLYLALNEVKILRGEAALIE